MDTIIVVLFLLLPTIFGVIGKKFEAAGKEGENEGETQSQPTDPMKKLAELLGMENPTESSTEANEDRFPMPDIFSEDSVEEDEPVDVAPVHEEPVYTAPVRPEPAVVAETPRPVAATEVQQRARLAAMKSQIAQQEEEKKQKMVIDPKKLVIYSEIMKPKFSE